MVEERLQACNIILSQLQQQAWSQVDGKMNLRVFCHRSSHIVIVFGAMCAYPGTLELIQLRIQVKRLMLMPQNGEVESAIGWVRWWR